MSDNILETRKVTKRFGGLVAVSSVDFNIGRGSITSLIGPNGAGKTTLFNVITGIYKPEEGGVTFDGHELVGRRSDQIASLGVSRTFQNIRLFADMTVQENVLVGMHPRLKQSTLDAIFQTPRFRKEEKAAQTRARDLLRFVALAGQGDALAKNLPYGGQRRVEIARALAGDPKVILLDEPTAGMNPHETEEAMTLFRRLRDELGITVLLIEHDMRVVMGISEHVTVLDYGEKIAEGTPAEVRSDARVIEAYLGRGATVTSIGAPDSRQERA
jgi:branched-chain amino acid transport system ATP-binding protein